ncbi:MAG: oligosaccharide flippase family protein [Candidatus Omnitrophica bacterium]|nr:oligosaccharide flippase family protein [Candidatus Omnitrophota bacterium]
MSEEKEKLSFSHAMIRNTTWNLFGQGCLFLVVFFSTPFIIRTLGVNLYGIYAFVSVIIGYFSFLQLGLGAASIKYISQYLAAKEEEKIRSIFWVCLFTNIFLGLVGMGIIFLSAPFLVGRFLKMPQELKETCIFVLKAGSFGFLIALIQSAVAGAIQAAGRFDTLNRVSVLFGTLQALTAVAILKMGFSIKGMIISNLVVSAVAVYVYWLNTKKIYPFLRNPFWDGKALIKLFKFGSFVTVSSVVNPILLNIEKIILTSMRSVASLAYYSVPFSLVDRLTMIRSSFSAVLFPAFSSLQDSYEAKKSEVNKDLHFRSTLYIIFLYSFFALFFLYFGKDFLKVWLGSDFANNSTKALVILAFAGLINACAAPSMNALQGMDRPHLPAIFHVFETVLYIPLALILIYKFGTTGAALAWFLRVLLDMLLLHKASCDLLGENIFVWYANILRRALSPILFSGLLFWWLESLRLPLLSPLTISLIICVFILYVFMVWRWGMDNFDRVKISDFLNIYLNKLILRRS